MEIFGHIVAVAGGIQASPNILIELLVIGVETNRDELTAFPIFPLGISLGPSHFDFKVVAVRERGDFFVHVVNGVRNELILPTL